MGNGTVTEHIRKNSRVDRINLVSGFVLALGPVRTLNFAVVGRGRRPSLPPLVQHDPRRLKGHESFDPLSTVFPRVSC